MDGESIQKMLRSVLQSSKEGVALGRLPSEYRLLCGHAIPLQALGFSRLEDYLRSIPSVVRLEHCMGELRCFAAVCKETAHIAELVARQKSSKKSGQSQLVNCRMRFKRSDPYAFNAFRSSLRQPSDPCWTARRIPPQRHSGSVCVERRRGATAPSRGENNRPSERTAAEAPPPQASPPPLDQPGLYSEQQLQARLGQLLLKYRCGLWLSKLPQVYGEMFAQQLHPQALAELHTWTHVCMVEKPLSGRADCLIYPPLPGSTPPAPAPTTTTTTTGPSPLPVPKPQIFPKSALARAKQPVTSPPGGPQCPPENAATTTVLDHRGRCHPSAAHIAPSQAPPLPPSQDIPPLPKNNPTPFSRRPALSAEDQQTRLRVKELLVKYSQGLWAPALPRLYADTYKVPFPQHVLDNLALLMDFCRVEYPMPHDKSKAILYYSGIGGGGAGGGTNLEASDVANSRGLSSFPLPSGVALVSAVTPPALVVPQDQFPSVLVTETRGSSAVTIRYVGEKYSNAQEAMEESMRSFYRQGSAHLRHLSRPVVGQLVAIRAEQGDELARGQVQELLAAGVKVYYVDYGFSAMTSVASLLELHRDFLSLAFQATNIQLAGLEAFSSHPALQASLDELAVGKILLMETLKTLEVTPQASSPPVAVLYDTSQEEDVNVNAACLAALQDKTMNNPLTVNVTYEDVRVTTVCPEGGVVYCQLPSRGGVRLRKLLEDTEAIFSTQVTSDSLLSRPFSGQLCLARHQGSWSRVQISNTYGSRVMEIVYVDLGLQATVEVTDLREIPTSLSRYLALIPPQATRCRLAELPVPEGNWSPEAVLMVKEALLDSGLWKMKIVKLEQHKDECLVHAYLFIGADSHDPGQSINRRLAQSHLWNRVPTPELNGAADANGMSAEEPGSNTDQAVSSTPKLCSSSVGPPEAARRLPLPPALEEPQAGQTLDVFVPVACHPGHFVLQQWQELHKLMVLMGEMMLYYNRTWKANRAPRVHKGEVYAAKIDRNWRRVQAKGILANGFVSVYELDHGRHELVHGSHFQPLIEEFRQLPFQAMAAQLAGVSHRQWSEEAAMLFRNHVEDRALVARVEGVQEKEVQGEAWERRWSVYLVDTTQEDRDLWVHSVMADLGGELSSAA